MVANFDLTSFLSKSSASNWIDGVCLVVLVINIVLGYMKGFSCMLATLLGILLALQGGYWLYPTIAYFCGSLAFCRSHPILGSIVPYLLAVAIGFAAFLLLRLLLHRFFKLLVEQPVDRIFGMVTGIAQGLLLLFFLFTLVCLLPQTCKFRQVAGDQSRAGHFFTPCVRSLLQIRPESLVLFKSEPEVSKKKPRQSPSPAKKPASKPKKKRS